MKQTEVEKETEIYVRKMIHGRNMTALEIMEEVEKAISFLGYNDLHHIKKER